MVGLLRFAVAVLLIVFTLGYMLPAAIALMRGHQAIAIFLLNLLLGWTVIGWIIALIWSLSDKQQMPGINIIQQNR